MDDCLLVGWDGDFCTTLPKMLGCLNETYGAPPPKPLYELLDDSYSTIKMVGDTDCRVFSCEHTNQHPKSNYIDPYTALKMITAIAASSYPQLLAYGKQLSHNKLPIQWESKHSIVIDIALPFYSALATAIANTLASKINSQPDSSTLQMEISSSDKEATCQITQQSSEHSKIAPWLITAGSCTLSAFNPPAFPSCILGLLFTTFYTAKTTQQLEESCYTEMENLHSHSLTKHVSSILYSSQIPAFISVIMTFLTKQYTTENGPQLSTLSDIALKVTASILASGITNIDLMLKNNGIEPQKQILETKNIARQLTSSALKKTAQEVMLIPLENLIPDDAADMLSTIIATNLKDLVFDAELEGKTLTENCIKSIAKIEAERLGSELLKISEPKKVTDWRKVALILLGASAREAAIAMNDNLFGKETIPMDSLSDPL